MTLEPLLLWSAAGLYVGATAFAIFFLLRPREGAERLIMILIAIALVPQTAAMVVRGVEVAAFPIASVHDGLLAFTLLAALIALVVAWRGGIPQVAPLAVPLLGMLMIIAALVEPGKSVPEALRSTWLGVHIGLALLGDAALAIAGVVAIAYLIQERRLKQRKRPGRGRTGTGLHNLPALEILDKVSVQLIKLGFPLMTLGLVSGSLYGREVWGSYWSWDPRNTVSFLVWVLYAAILHARFTVGWRGRKAAILTVVGVIAILLAFVGLGLLGVGTHGKDYVS
ncbi:MAG: c-type cytochrome biogenesis protein CcsB [Deltaproteobacteria bacterium]|nr:c-type cytochrome biogenesis protein CcsB [Deltaproteobacteria bacterium]